MGRIIERVMGERLDPGRLQSLFEIGVDEVSWRRHHRFLTLVSNHHTNSVVMNHPGFDGDRVSRTLEVR
jgi:transposase